MFALCVAAFVAAFVVSAAGCGASDDICMYYGKDMDSLSVQVNALANQEPVVGQNGVEGKACGKEAIRWCDENYPAGATKPKDNPFDLNFTWKSTMDECDFVRRTNGKKPPPDSPLWNY